MDRDALTLLGGITLIVFTFFCSILGLMYFEAKYVYPLKFPDRYECIRDGDE